MVAALAFASLGPLAMRPADAASFDCARASAPDERAVCADPALSAMDSEMGGLWFAYSRLPMLMGGNGARHEAARDFLAARGRCGADAGCLTGLYQARIAALKQQIVAFIAGMPPP
ncbi:uncharacterized protein FHS55_001821 [Angulomicrobium tetraedrale]|uniref:Lysozyme inhibitor LprI N-terminal domain-containing protein n=1 Tax=Ancylobacter tetraedralis TaxID=217068 RepID=A0A839Z6B6_9HYPH|nr:hypothetical protein [Ancylobacter tetraedralis]MBB3771222.1 uncharacterized protein [Ancylobacter tetraedralis]